MRKIVLSLIILATFSIANAQQTPQYSLHVLDPLLLNPAVAGSTSNPDFKIHHRMQWVGFKGAPISSSISYHVALSQKTGIGGYIFNDQIGPVRKTGLNLAYAHHIPVRTFWVSMALSASVVQNELDGTEFNIQDPTDALVQAGVAATKITPDVNLGFLAYNQDFYIGASVLQMVPFNVRYTGSNMKYSNHFYFTGGYAIRPTKGFDLEPSLTVEYVMGAPVNIDFNFKAFINRQLTLGLSYRNDNSIVGMFGYRFNNRYFLGYSYDLVLTKMGVPNSIGSHEILLAFQWPNSKKIKPLFDLKGNVRGQLKKRLY
jgi:type IX secretion system PorP/SprF family membrane protein